MVDQFQIDPDEQLEGAAWVATVLEQAIARNVSDVQLRYIGNIDAAEGILLARASVNRRYQVWGQISGQKAAVALGFVKNSAHMTTGPITRPYFDRWAFETGEGNVIDIRVTATSTGSGETFALRIPTMTKVPLLSVLRMSDHNRQLVMQALKHANGGYVLVGPGSSGKSVTADSMMQFVAAKDINAVAVEDPIERRLAGVDQIEINEDTGNSYADVLKLLRRLHMQVLKLGEINFGEAAKAAIEIANAGTRVFTTLHANDAVAGLEALQELADAPGRLVANSVRVVISQRLVRQICVSCRKQGCQRCGGTGVNGVLPIHEVLLMNDELIELFSRGVGRRELLAAAERAGMRSLWADADELIAAGKTDEEEAEFEIGPRS